MNTIRQCFILALGLLFFAVYPMTEGYTASLTPLRVVVDLGIGEVREVRLPDGSTITVQLHNILATRDNVTRAVRSAGATLSINGQQVTVATGTYTLPITVGQVKLDCPVTRDYYPGSQQDDWHLVGDARIRLWPAGSPYIQPGTFTYPVKQRIFASDTQMSNEPAFVNGKEYPRPTIYYHEGLDFGGAEGTDEVVAAADGLILSANTQRIDGYEDYHTFLKAGVIYMLDDRGWLLSYNHLYSVDSAVKPGVRVKQGQTLGRMGKEGLSGGYTHLHFKIRSRTTSGEWATEEAYPFIWEAYHRQYNPSVIAIARPHHLAKVGETVTLDGNKSWNAASFEWSLSMGMRALGPVQQIRYERPGTYSEILKVTDAQGQVDYDFAVVQVVNPELDSARVMPPTIHAAYHPTQNIRANDAITFMVRSFNVDGYGKETWDFGDGSPAVTVQSLWGDNHNPDGYASTKHHYSRPGDYIVTVSRSNKYGDTATAHLHIEVI